MSTISFHSLLSFLYSPLPQLEYEDSGVIPEEFCVTVSDLHYRLATLNTTRVQGSLVLYNKVQGSVVNYSAVQCSAVQ